MSENLEGHLAHAMSDHALANAWNRRGDFLPSVGAFLAGQAPALFAVNGDGDPVPTEEEASHGLYTLDAYHPRVAGSVLTWTADAGGNPTTDPHGFRLSFGGGPGRLRMTSRRLIGVISGDSLFANRLKGRWPLGSQLAFAVPLASITGIHATVRSRSFGRSPIVEPWITVEVADRGARGGLSLPVKRQLAGPAGTDGKPDGRLLLHQWAVTIAACRLAGTESPAARAHLEGIVNGENARTHGAHGDGSLLVVDFSGEGS